MRCSCCRWRARHTDVVDATSLESLPRCPECGALARPAVVWFGVVNSVLAGSSADLVNRLERNIDQAFNQSEYLKH